MISKEKEGERKKEKEAKARGTPPKLGPVTALHPNTDFQNNASPEGNPVIIKENGVQILNYTQKYLLFTRITDPLSLLLTNSLQEKISDLQKEDVCEIK